MPEYRQYCKKNAPQTFAWKASWTKNQGSFTQTRDARFFMRDSIADQNLKVAPSV